MSPTREGSRARFYFPVMNKLDRPARDPLALLDELESVLGISAFPVNWPLGDGPEFRGVYDRHGSLVTGSPIRASCNRKNVVRPGFLFSGVFRGIRTHVADF